MQNNVYKILKTNEWEEALLTGKVVTDLDTRDGFIHLSTASQLAATLSLFFRDIEVVVLLQIDLEKVDKAKLVYEKIYPKTGKRNATFPHLYTQMKINQISNTWFLERCSFDLPEEVLLQAENQELNQKLK